MVIVDSFDDLFMFGVDGCICPEVGVVNVASVVTFDVHIFVFFVGEWVECFGGWVEDAFFFEEFISGDVCISFLLVCVYFVKIFIIGH